MKLQTDWLRENCQKIHSFGLGFVQLKIDDQTRLHFYAPALCNLKNVADTQYHNHRYDFISHVLMGELHQAILPYKESYEYFQGYNIALPRLSAERVYVSCDPKKLAPEEKDNVFVENPIWSLSISGESYYMPIQNFHKVHTCVNTITYLLRSHYITQFAQVIQDPGTKKVCPFEINLPEKECWEIVDSLIKEKSCDHH